MIEEIIQREWDFFQEVHNIGGRASCQDNFETFYLQRKGQFEVFYPEVNESYLKDLKLYKEIGRNPIMEKYAYMMESTDKDYYDTIKDQLPERSEEQMDIINTICRIEVAMREVFDQQYPRLSSLARDTHTGDDQQENTSFETYLRGELSTYSPETLYLYGRMIANMYQNGQNMILMIQEKTVQAYGYRSLDDAEAKM
ncbi:DUF4125 family protein [[Clostridium] spiroforme]|nr:DUF4125 family protein [Thomasclavelia spiroformis]MBM6880782.1 DUF4125 family protein [Thomasclavelia spiroformis]MBM6931199.1 DUF4125 family protein [Thomasclavelia spiroformis]